jgi:hypothetical protein
LREILFRHANPLTLELVVEFEILDLEVIGTGTQRCGGTKMNGEKEGKICQHPWIKINREILTISAEVWLSISGELYQDCTSGTTRYHGN